eukprot:2232648-Rhodomonas_salina.2
MSVITYNGRRLSYDRAGGRVCHCGQGMSAGPAGIAPAALHTGSLNQAALPWSRAAAGALDTAKECVKTATEEPAAAEREAEAVKEELMTAKEDSEAAEGKLEAAEVERTPLEAAPEQPEQQALAQKAHGRAETAYQLAVKNVKRTREGVKRTREGVQRAGRAVDIAADAAQRAGAGLSLCIPLPRPSSPASSLFHSPSISLRLIHSSSSALSSQPCSPAPHAPLTPCNPTFISTDPSPSA